jgi:dynein assembly factor 2, axonemal
VLFSCTYISNNTKVEEGMPLERVNLARGAGGAAAAGAPPAEAFKATPEELRVIEEKMKDPVFVELMHDYMKSLEDPETRREEEAYLEQAEREAREGGDFSFEFVFPRAAYAVELLEPSNVRVTAAEAKRLGVAAEEGLKAAYDTSPTVVRSFLNVCQSDKIKAFTEHTTGDPSGSNWEVPVSVSQRRVEVYNPAPSSPSARIPAEYAATTTAGAPQLCVVHDVVFHPSTLSLAERSTKFMCFLIEIAVEHLNSGYGESNGFKFRRLPSSVVSIGTPQNQTLRTTHDTTPFAADPHDPVLQRSIRHIAATTTAPTTTTPAAAARDSGMPALPSGEGTAGHPTPSTNTTLQLPPYTIAHRGSIDLTDAWRWSVSDKRVGVPQELVVKLTFAEVRRAAALDITVTDDSRALRITRTEGQPRYEGEVPLPFAVEEVPTLAQFDRTRGVLTLTLKVVPPPRPEGVPTAEELRSTLPGAVGATNTGSHSRQRDCTEKAVSVVTLPSQEVAAATQIQCQPSSDCPPPTSSAPHTSPPLHNAAAAQTDNSPSAPPLPAVPANKPEVAHIGEQDRVAAMMAQVVAARAARVAAEAAAAAAEDEGGKDSPKDDRDPTYLSAAAADATLAASTCAVLSEARQSSGEHPLSGGALSSTAVDANSNELSNSVGTQQKEQEGVPFIRKAASQPTAVEALKNDAAHDTEEEAVVRARQQAWAAMMAAEMQVAKAREEAEAAEAARAAEVQATKARRKLAAEKEQERLEQLAQAKRDTLPLSNKYLFAID